MLLKECERSRSAYRKIATDRRREGEDTIRPNAIVTKLLRIDSDAEALTEQWIGGTLTLPASLPRANMSLVQQNLVHEKGWREIEALKRLSMEGLHIVSYVSTSTADNKPNIKKLISSSRVTEFSQRAKENNELLMYSDFFQNKLKLSHRFGQGDEKEKLCRFLGLHQECWNRIECFDDLIACCSKTIREWIRFTFWLRRRDFFLAIFEVIRDAFTLLSEYGVKYLLPITERNIIFYMVEEVEAVAGKPITINYREFPVYNTVMHKEISTCLALLNIGEIAKTMREFPHEYLPVFWGNVKRRRKRYESLHRLA